MENYASAGEKAWSSPNERDTAAEAETRPA